MKWLKRFSVLICVLALILPSASLAAKPDDRGTGYGGGGGMSDEGVLYGDLYVVLRDENGVPILEPLSAQGYPDIDCPQPVYIEDDLCQVIHMDNVEGSCEIPEWGLEYVVGIETGRLSVSRTTDDVLDSAYAEAAKNIENADDVDLDPAFRLRLIFHTYDEYGDPILDQAVYKTIDSPLENVAMYKKVMLNGRFPSITVDPMGDGETVVFDPCSNNPVFAGNFPHLCDTTFNIDDLETAASFIAAGSDKFGQITLDVLVNINSNLGINVLDTQANPPTITYFDLDQFGTDYNTQIRYGEVEEPFVELLNGPMDGFPAEETWFKVESRYVPGSAPFADALSCKKFDIGVRGPTKPMEGGGGAHFFTQAADDARAVIEFLHNWSIPEYE